MASVHEYRKLASKLYGKLEMDVTDKEITVARKAHKMFLIGKSVSTIRTELKIPAIALTERDRAKAAVDAAIARNKNNFSSWGMKERFRFSQADLGLEK